MTAIISHRYFSGAPDPRWHDDPLATLEPVKGRDLEVVRMGGVTE